MDLGLCLDLGLVNKDVGWFENIKKVIFNMIKKVSASIIKILYVRMSFKT